MKAILSMSGANYKRLINHLVPANHLVEEAAFIFAELKQDRVEIEFIPKDIYFLKPEDFNIQTSYHIELADHIRGDIIKKAHDMNTAIIELHSHVGDYNAGFSPSDFYGFDEIVPHMIWRLKKPYAAIVFTKSDFDGLVWVTTDEKPLPIDYIKFRYL